MMDCLTANVINLAIKGEALSNLIMSLPEPAHIKDIATGKYICSNVTNLKVYGLKDVSQIIGKTVQDLDLFMRPFWGEDFAAKIEIFDKKVQETKKIVEEKDRILVAHDGTIHIQDMAKVPVFNGNKVAAIFTHSHDKTDFMDLFSLFDIYQKTYKTTADVRKYFCKYLKIDVFFSELPTVAELKVILYAKGCRHIKEIASRMNRSQRNVESHLTHINSKIKNPNLNYNDLLEFILVARETELQG